jgi:hypothetical protein
MALPVSQSPAALLGSLAKVFMIGGLMLASASPCFAGIGGGFNGGRPSGVSSSIQTA